MSETPFTGFGTFSRPEVGLISDGSQNLGEIFDSDKRTALRNVLLQPEILDAIQGISQRVGREDLRSVSGLSSLLLPSLSVQSEVFFDVIPTRLFVDKEFYGPDSPLGGPGSPQVKQSNIVLFNGLIKCEGAEYRANTIGERLFTDPVRQRVSLSTSRSSLFNTEADTVNLGFFLSAKYPGSIRVRKRSHVNRIFVPNASFITRSVVAENPSHTIRVDIDNGNTGTSVPVRLLATKNTPLRVFCRLGTGSIRFTFTDSLAPYFFGYQIQPVQQRPNRPLVEFLPTIPVSQTIGSDTFTLDLDITSTGYQNLYDLYLYVYVNPEKVRGIEFIGINLKETPDRRDLGLIGFNNLEVFRVSGGSLTILPLWLKTLNTKLTTIDLSASGDTWRSGLMGWFDYRDSTALPSLSLPLYTAVSYLTIPKRGTMVDENGTGWSDARFEKYITDAPRTAGTDYRQLTTLTSLLLGSRFRGLNPRFDDIAPALNNLQWGGSSTQRTLFGTLPRIAKPSTLITYNISGSGAQGNINQIGTSTDPANSGYISRYRMNSFNVSGINVLGNAITGFIGDPAEDWSEWRLNCTSIAFTLAGNNISIDLQSGKWESLSSLSVERSGGVQFTTPSTALRAPNIINLNLNYTGTTGPMPSLGSSSSENTGLLASFSVTGSNGITGISTNGINYFLPTNFAPARGFDVGHRLTSLSASETNWPYRFRQRDLVNLNLLTRLDFANSAITGWFPQLPLDQLFETTSKQLEVVFNNSGIYNVRSLSISTSNFYIARDLVRLDAYNLNVSGGGALLPTFQGISRSQIRYIDLANSQRSTYPSDWLTGALRGSCISISDDATEITGLSMSNTIQSGLGAAWHPNDDIYTLTGGSGFRQRVLVNDSVRESATGVELARVMSVSDTSVTIDRDIPGTLPETLFFTRNTNPIDNWFGVGFINTERVKISNCRLSGTLNIRSGMYQVSDQEISALDLSENLLTGYTVGSLSLIFSGNARRVTVNLSRNRLSANAIRDIINEIYEIDQLRRFSNCRVLLASNKVDANSRYINYPQSELFPATVRQNPDLVTNLFRNEQLNIYSDVTVTDEFGNTTIDRVVVGTITVSVPGLLIGTEYYKTRTDKIQSVIENPIAARFKNLSGIRIDLGFNYTSPSTSPVVYDTVYSNLTTRNQSLIDAGYDPADLVNP
jgi:hypothetical protein